MLQEPVIRNNSISNVPKSHKPIVPFTKDKARVALLLPKDLARVSMTLGNFSSQDSIVVRSKLKNNVTLVIASIYMDKLKPIPAGLLNRLSEYAEKERMPLIVGVDTNAHHVAWGHENCDTRGRDLLLELNSNNLVLCNSGNRPTFVGKLGHSCIDLTIANTLGANLLRNWEVTQGKSLSDHEAIRFNLALDSQVSFATRSISKCNWQLYQQLVEAHFTQHPFWFAPVTNIEDLSARQLFVSDTLRSCFNTACPFSRGTRRTSIPWWNAELTKVKQTAKALRRKANRSRNNSDWLLYREASRTYKQKLKQAKRTGWKAFCDSVKKASTLARINKIINMGSTNIGNLNSLRKSNGELTDSPQETLQVLTDTLIPSDGEQEPSQPYGGGDTQTILKIVAPHRVDRAIKELATNKAPGPDEIRNEMITKAWKWIKDPVRMIFHHSLALGATPSSWHHITGCVIPKPLKTDYTNPRAFRIISLTSSFQKILERLILWHLEQDLNIPGRLTKNQHGFKKGKSTESAIHSLVRRIEDAMASGNYSLGVFLDIEQAFDAVSFKAIKEGLLEAGIPPTVSEWIHHMVSNRLITVSHCGESITKKATKGSPQGGVLSPLLWNLTLNTFLSSLGIHSNFIQAFADDLVILIRGICKHTIRDIAQQHLTNINRWCHTKGLKLSGIKSTAILFTNKRDRTLDQPLMVEGDTVPLCNSTVYLGVTLDSKLSWGPHIMKKCDSATGTLHACKRAVGKTWGLSPSGIRWIYNQVILPAVMYSSVVWHHSAEQKLYLKQRLDTVQRQAAIMITRGLRSAPTANLEIIAGIKPISLKLQENVIKAALRLKITGNWDNSYQFNKQGTSASHAYTIESTLNSIPYSSSTLLDGIPAELVLDRRYKTIIEDRESAISHISDIPPDTWQIYTDGSKQGSLTGAGFCVFRNHGILHKQSYQLGTIATVYQSELFAINMGCTWATSTITSPGTITFLSDSQAAIKALCTTQIKSRLVKDTLLKLNMLGALHSVQLRWVPGHVGLQGNEQADELAREGSGTPPIGPEPFLPLPNSLILAELRKRLLDSHLRSYRRLDISDKGKTPLTSYLSKHNYNLPRLSGTHIRWLTWILTGHSPLAYFQHRTNNSNFPSPYCEHCPEEEETSEHFMCECIAYMTIRLRTFGKAITNMADIAKSSPGLITKYIKLTGRFNRDDLFG